MIERLADVHDMDEVGLWIIRRAGFDPANVEPGSVETTSVLLEFPVAIEQVTVSWVDAGVMRFVRIHFDLVNAEDHSFSSTSPTQNKRETPA